ncbi:hypothetical protein [Microbacterium sp. SORGH_AS_0421]|uniref:hypothetical protein n=1 Tax=Microbacterium sp. SORGH_AS_0421 TaxID=3041768 RepID=UPI002794C9DE|nr:hypothetical protein [Microbacterium sp. SORGH_AS_0421]MDQ1176678.1 hypothetical protein [Microbacterium sp. SORGH_AS_0421]
MSSLTSVLSFREARGQLGHALDTYRHGANPEILVFGSHRKAEAAVVPYALVDRLLSRVDDEEIAAIVRERRAMASEPLSTVAARFGIDLDAV